jgi:pimeloyl-ACP methyl ester carboxylesterase
MCWMSTDAVVGSDIPVHVLWGGSDAVAPLAIAHTLKARAPHIKLTVLERAGHFAMIEAPEEWSRAFLAFDAYTSQP